MSSMRRYPSHTPNNKSGLGRLIIGTMLLFPASADYESLWLQALATLGGGLIILWCFASVAREDMGR